jgi:hypothetical protein
MEKSKELLNEERIFQDQLKKEIALRKEIKEIKEKQFRLNEALKLKEEALELLEKRISSRKEKMKIISSIKKERSLSGSYQGIHFHLKDLIEEFIDPKYFSKIDEEITFIAEIMETDLSNREEFQKFLKPFTIRDRK